VRLFAGNRNPPTNSGPRDAEIAKAAFDEAQIFVAAGLRLNEGWVLLVKSKQRLLKRGKF